jgi:O-acetyl-ADP-ribose deacetylase (regulator of RNase III)
MPTSVQVTSGDITRTTADATVNSVFELRPPFQGLCGAYVRAAGPQLPVILERYAANRPGGILPLGECIVTESYNMTGVRRILHVNAADERPECLPQAYDAALDAAVAQRAQSIALPVLGGNQPLPPFELLRAMVEAVQRFEQRHIGAELRYIVFFVEANEVAPLQDLVQRQLPGCLVGGGDPGVHHDRFHGQMAEMSRSRDSAAAPPHTHATDMLQPTWFSHALGFHEGGPGETEQRLHGMAQVVVDAGSGRTVLQLRRPDGRAVQAGAFDVVSLQQLRQQAQRATAELHAATHRHPGSAAVLFTNIVGDAAVLHSAEQGALHQAASQSNCLEMPNPDVSPDAGITAYAADRTQGPACAMACAGGTAVRQYFGSGAAVASHSSWRRQTATEQIDTMGDVRAWLQRRGVTDPWTTTNGYIESSDAALAQVTEALRGHEDEAMALLQIGVQYDTEVTSATNSGGGDEGTLTVHQAYCAAISVGYSTCAKASWQPLAELVLRAAYEATLLVSVVDNASQALGAWQRREPAPRPRPIFLTKVGGGCFGNDHAWIVAAIEHAAGAVAQHGVALQAAVVHYKAVDAVYQRLCDDV